MAQKTLKQLHKEYVAAKNNYEDCLLAESYNTLKELLPPTAKVLNIKEITEKNYIEAPTDSARTRYTLMGISGDGIFLSDEKTTRKAFDYDMGTDSLQELHTLITAILKAVRQGDFVIARDGTVKEAKYILTGTCSAPAALESLNNNKISEIIRKARQHDKAFSAPSERKKTTLFEIIDAGIGYKNIFKMKNNIVTNKYEGDRLVAVSVYSLA